MFLLKNGVKQNRLKDLHQTVLVLRKGSLFKHFAHFGKVLFLFKQFVKADSPYILTVSLSVLLNWHSEENIAPTFIR